MSEPICLRLTAATPDALEHALDACHVAFDVLAVVEAPDELMLSVDASVADVTRVLPPGVHCDVVAADREWTGLEDDAPIFVGDRICVRPPWVDPPTDFTGITLVVPRGNAFGSGEHASTQAALRALDANWPDDVGSFLDVGTGSGVLALYARERGVGRIAACDIDEASVRAARDLLPPADVREGGPEGFAPEHFDVVVANLSGAELCDALPSITARWNGRGVLVLSGMREHEASGIRDRVDAPYAPMHAVGAFRAYTFYSPHAGG